MDFASSDMNNKNIRFVCPFVLLSDCCMIVSLSVWACLPSALLRSKQQPKHVELVHHLLNNKHAMEPSNYYLSKDVVCAAPCLPATSAQDGHHCQVAHVKYSKKYSVIYLNLLRESSSRYM